VPSVLLPPELVPPALEPPPEAVLPPAAEAAPPEDVLTPPVALPAPPTSEAEPAEGDSALLHAGTALNVERAATNNQHILVLDIHLSVGSVQASALPACNLRVPHELRYGIRASR